MAALTTAIWGTTLISSKILLHAGMSPAEILLGRFFLGYLFLWILYPRTHKIKILHDEVLFAAMGFFGGTIYFLTENTALIYTNATNVSLICATVPLATALLSHLIIKKEQISKQFITGSLISFSGVVLVILNGNFILKLNPIGDLLTVIAVFSWSLYCVLLKRLKGKYNSLFITRNLFFYGLLTLLPYFLFKPFEISFQELRHPIIWGNLCFLGLVASSLCYWMWNISMENLGVVKTNSYIYFLPLVTIITASFFLSEHITLFIICGTILIIFGLWKSNKK